MLLNPTDPEAIFRRKAGKEYRGYVANIEETNIVVDGAYYSEEAQKIASEKNIQILPTALALKNNRRGVSGFELNEDQSKVIKCPAGNTPNFCCYKPSNDEFKLSLTEIHVQTVLTKISVMRKYSKRPLKFL